MTSAKSLFAAAAAQGWKQPVTILCCLLKYSGVVCVGPCDTLDSSFPAECLENSYLGAAGFHFNSALASCCVNLHFSPEVLSIEVKEKAVWLEWAEPVNLTALRALGQSQFHSEFPPAKVLAYANNFLRAENLLLPIGHVEQNRKLGLLCAANEEAAPLSRGHRGAVTW